MSSILEIRELHAYIGQYHILQNVDFIVPKDSVTVLLGRNGAGKTTTLKSILGLTTIKQGKVIFEGQEVQGMHTYEIGALGIGYVPENRIIFRNLSVEENLKIAERKNGDYDNKKDFLFDLFPDLKKFLMLKGTNLSGGQQQMLAIARALVADNHLLLIDEPSEGLAPVIIEHLIDVIHQLSQHITVLLVEQNFLVASKLANYFVIIEEGQSVETGKMKDLENDKAMIHRYLGAA